ncbi:MAG: hypothetical protein U0271_40830 [Polyangiaceae bacterium]
MSWLLALSFGCGDSASPGGGGAGGDGGSVGGAPMGGDDLGGAGGSGGEASSWTSGTGHFAPTWQAAIRCTSNQVGSRVGRHFIGKEGDVWLGGTLDGACDAFGAATTEEAGTHVFATRLAGSTGAPVFSRAFAQGDAIFGFGLVGLSGGLKMAGGFDAPVMFDALPAVDPPALPDHTPAWPTFIVDLDAAGAASGVRSLGVEYTAATLAVNESGRLAVATGSYESDFGDGFVTVPLGAAGVAVLNADNSVRWQTVVTPAPGLTSMFFGHRVAISSDGSVLLTGVLRGELSIGGFDLSSPTTLSPTLLAFDPDGAVRGARVLPASEDWCELDAAALSDGGFVVSQVCSGTVEAEASGVLGSAGQTSAFVLRLNQDGAVDWGRALGTSGVDSIVVNESANGGVVLGGSFLDTIDLGDGAMASAGRRDLFLAELDASGETSWSQRMGGEWDEGIDSISQLPSGDLVVSSNSLLGPDPTPEEPGFILEAFSRLHAQP